MIKDNQKVFNRLHLVMDALIVIISYVLAWVLHFKVFNHFRGSGCPFPGTLPAGTYFHCAGLYSAVLPLPCV